VLTRFRPRLLALAALLLASGAARAQTISLDGTWAFAVDSAGAFTLEDVGTRAHWREATVPLPWQAQFADLRTYHGVAWYRKSFGAPTLGPGETTLLHFGAVDYHAEVFVNGTRVGAHEGGFTPFRFDVGALLRGGANEVVVRVIEPAVAPGDTEGLTFEEVPHGKQSWYVNASGLWQSVRLEVRPRRHVEHVHVAAQLDGTVRAHVALAGEGAGALTFRVLDPAGREVARQTLALEEESASALLEGVVEAPAWWSPDTPSLYTAEVTVGADRFTQRFGFRQVEARDGRIWLNGAPFFMIGALDQDFYPGTIYTPPSEDFIRDQMRKAKALGLNTLRMHVKVPDPRYLEIADEEGLLVWLDLPNHWTWTPAAARRAEATLDELYERDWNHPSLAVLSLVNESWGVDLAQPEQRAWLLGFVERAKEKSPGWLVVDNSACWGNFHLRTDLADWHTYWAIPENRHRFDQTVDDLAARPDWLFSPHGDAVETGSEPLVLSEFGNWGLPDVPEELPWWLRDGMDDIDVTVPAGVHDRFRAYGYDTVFGSYAALAEASQHAQARALRYQIEKLRRTPEIAGYVITELTDLNWESNGLLDMERNVKAGMDALADVQRPDVVLPVPRRYTGRASADTLAVDVWLSHFGTERGPVTVAEECCAGRIIAERAGTTGATTLFWSSGGAAGTVAVPPLAPGEVRRVEPVRVPLPGYEHPARLRVAFRWERPDGRVLAENETELFVFPPAPRPSAVVHDPAGRLGAVSALVAPDPAADVLVAPTLDALVLAHLAAGGRAVVFADSQTVLPEGFPLRLVSRAEEFYDGNWVTNLNWLRRDHPPFDRLGFGPTLGFEAAEVELGHVVEGIAPGDFGDVLAGFFAGWLQLNAGYVVQMNVGAGRLLLVTMRPRSADDPYAQHLVWKLVEYAGSDAFRPGLTWTPRP
jgi:hypothetical protein